MQKILEDLYEQIAHGDEVHKQWLYNKMEDFQRENIVVSDDQLDTERKHYFELGKLEGMRKFDVADFILGVSVGFQIVALLSIIF